MEELKSQIEWMEEDLRQLKSQLPVKLYRHYRNKKYYVITGKCMVQLNDEWKQAVIYCLHEGDGQLFCREKSEFISKFKIEE